MGVPVVLDLVIRSPGELSGNQRPPAKRASMHHFFARGMICCPKIVKDVPVAERSMKTDDHLLFLRRDVASLQVRSEVVYPPQPATLSASKKSFNPEHATIVRKLSRNVSLSLCLIFTCILGERSPRTFAVGLNVIHENLVLLRCPSPFLQPLLLAARSSPHLRT